MHDEVVVLGTIGILGGGADDSIEETPENRERNMTCRSFCTTGAGARPFAFETRMRKREMIMTHYLATDHFREEDTKKCRCCPCILSSLFDPGSSSSSGPTLGNDVIRPTFYSTTQHHAPPVDMT